MEPKTILITGAASGFGRATAAKLIEAGHIVYPADLNSGSMDDLKDLGARPLGMDVTDEAAVQVGVELIMQDEGRIDVCVNNAGFATYDLIESSDLNRARMQMEVNFWGTVLVTRAALPHMRKAKTGRFVNTSSVAGVVAGPLTAWYAASKHAAEAFSDALRLETASLGIGVSIVEPGSFNTGFADVVVKQFEHIAPAEEYKALVESYTVSYEASHSDAPSPEPVVDAMLDAILSPEPKTRYVVGADAEAITTAKKNMSDREFDNMILGHFGINRD